METNLGNRLNLARLLVFAIMGEVALLLLNGSDVACVLLLAGSLLCGVLIVLRGGLFNPLSMIAFVFLARYVWIASLLKIALGQPLESNLYVPTETFVMMLACAAQLLAAFELVSRLRLPGPLLPAFRDPEELKTYSYVTGAVGLVLMGAMTIHQRTEPELSGFYLFAENLYPMSIVARTAYVCKRYRNARTGDAVLVVMLGGGVAASMLMGMKIVAFSCLLAYSVTLVCMRRSVPVRLVALAGAMLVVLVLVVTPAVNLLRETAKMDDKTADEKLVILADRFWNRSVFATADEFGAREDSVVHYYDYFGQVGMFRPVVERVALVENGDALIRGIDVNGYLGSYLITESFMRLLPRVLNPDKDTVSTADYIVWHAGARRRDSIGFPTVGVIGSCYAVHGWATVLTLPFVLFTVFFLTLKALVGENAGGVWGAYFFVIYSHKFTECDVTPFLQIILRVIPLDLAALLSLFYVTRFLSTFVLASGGPLRQDRPGSNVRAWEF